ncbi:MAG: DUF2961 domain-containing protein, partial [Planctomycetota bacterium]
MSVIRTLASTENPLFSQRSMAAAASASRSRCMRNQRTSRRRTFSVSVARSAWVIGRAGRNAGRIPALPFFDGLPSVIQRSVFRNWNYGTIAGKGVYVGDSLSLYNRPATQGSLGPWWGEGDEKIFVDGEA